MFSQIFYILKTKLVLTLTILFLIFHETVVLAQPYANPDQPTLGTTTNFLLFTSLGAVTNTGTSSIYAGNVATNNGIISGFETLQSQPFGLFNANAATNQCATDLGLLYTELNTITADRAEAAAHEYGGQTLTPGVYHNTGAISVTGNLTLDGRGNSNARFIIRSSGAFTSGAGSKIILVNGAQAKNVFWIITGAISLAANVDAKGIFINAAAISIGAGVILEGAMLSKEGAITTLDGMNLSSPFMLLKKNQRITVGTAPEDLVLIGNTNPIVRWESATDFNFTNPTEITLNSETLYSSCIGTLSTTTFYRVVVLIDGVAVHSNIVKINVVPTVTLPDLGPLNSFVLFTKAGAVTNTGNSINNALIGTNFGAIGGSYSRPLLLNIQNSSTDVAANNLKNLFDSVKDIPTTDMHVAAFGSGEVLLPGIYEVNSAASVGGTIILDGKGSANYVFIIKITGALSFAAGSKVLLTNGAIAANVFWVIDGALSIGASSEVRGNYICLAGAVALGNMTIVEGRLFSIEGAITLDTSTLSIPVAAQSDQFIAAGTQPVELKLTGYVDEITKWQKSKDVLFSNPDDIINNTSILSVAEIGELSSTTYFRAVIKVNDDTINSSIATISINQTTIPLIVSANQEFCSPTQPSDLLLSGNVGTVIKWQRSSDLSFTIPIDIINTTNILKGVDIGIISVTTFYRAVVQNSSGCQFKYSNPVKMTITVPTTWDGNTWSNGAPSSTTSAIFAGNFNRNENIEACSITINNNAIVTINSGFTMTLTNGLTVSSGSLTFENNASLVQMNNNAINSGNISYKRITSKMKAFDYTYWSSPVAEQKLNILSPNTLSDKYFSFAYPNWVDENGANTMEVAKGYIIRVPKERTWPNNENVVYPYAQPVEFIGTPNNGHYSINAINPDSSFLIGNPYPSSLDADLFLAANSKVLDGTIYFWTHNTAITNNKYSSDDYASYNGVGGTATAAAPSEPIKSGINPNIPTGKIAAGQSFFGVSKTIITGTNEIIFDNNMRLGVSGSDVSNSQFFKLSNSTTKLKLVEKNRVWLNLTNSQGAFKQTLLGYVTGASNDFDNGYDGLTYDGNKFINLYSIQQQNQLGIQGRALPFNEDDTVALGFSTTINGIFTIAIGHVDGLFTNQSIFLEDKLTNTKTDLKTGNYNFTTVAGEFNERFVLSYTNKTLKTEDLNMKQSSIMVSTKSKEVNIISSTEAINKVFIYDISGKQIYLKNNINNKELTILNLASNLQVLFLKTVLENDEVITTKILY